MSRLTQRQAAAQWGIGRATVQRAIKAGSMTPDIDGRVDVADLLRVFGPARNRPSGPLGPLVEPPAHDPAQVARIARLEAEVEGLRALVASKDETIVAMRLLTHDQTPRKWRWWPF